LELFIYSLLNIGKFRKQKREYSTQEKDRPKIMQFNRKCPNLESVVKGEQIGREGERVVC